jgi:hypothetical protein
VKNNTSDQLAWALTARNRRASIDMMTDAAAPQGVRTFRIVGMVRFPARIEAAALPDTPGGLPKALRGRKVIQGALRFPVGGRTFVLSPWRGSEEFLESASKLVGGPFEPVTMTVEEQAATAMEAVHAIADDLEHLLDFTAFQLQHPIFCMSLDALDITPPLHLDEEREVLSFPFPHGLQPAKFRRMMVMGDIRGLEQPAVPINFGRKSNRADAALRWYAKALASPFEADQFCFFWIALEILCHDQPRGTLPQPYKAACGHEIPDCPICGAPTARRIGGSELKHFLSELGLSRTDARALWQMRQMFHGNNDLTHQAVETLPRLVLLLRGAVTVALKRALEYPAAALPLVFSTAPQIGAFWFGGKRKIAESDIAAGGEAIQ